MVGDELICTKVLGDMCVPTGSITWRGVPSACTFSGTIYGSNGIGGAIVGLPAQVQIVSPQEIIVSGIGTLYYFPSNTGHLDAMGVDYSTYPVSCIDCTSEFANVFTPNGDGVNDLLEPLCGARSALFSVRDRWGDVVYETMDPKPSWDGRVQWDPCPEGVYFWSLLDADDRSGRIKHGTVHLLR
jgi:gliding motility-associated-like protein